VRNHDSFGGTSGTRSANDIAKIFWGRFVHFEALWCLEYCNIKLYWYWWNHHKCFASYSRRVKYNPQKKNK
jgi:hypothetical protein